MQLSMKVKDASRNGSRGEKSPLQGGGGERTGTKQLEKREGHQQGGGEIARKLLHLEGGLPAGRRASVKRPV